MSVSEIVEKLQDLGVQAQSEIPSAHSLSDLEAFRLNYIGKKGKLSQILKALGQLDPEQRPVVGTLANQWKSKIESLLGLQHQKLKEAQELRQINQQGIDLSLPARRPFVGSLHPVTRVSQRLLEIFQRLGFELAQGPEVETDYLNFEAVNIPAEHPARDMQDSFFLGEGVVLRTHTSSVQMRAMRSQSWPLRILSPGAVYRADSDSTHSPMFHQLEGLWIDRGVRMSDLKGCLEYWAQELFGEASQIRLRPSFFPFVEPGAEVDVSCFLCHSQQKTSALGSCRVCKDTGWLEVLGAGMVHPRLFEMAGYEAYREKQVRGFAFGMGIERIAMLLYRIPDLRLFFQNDQRFLEQFV